MADPKQSEPTPAAPVPAKDVSPDMTEGEIREAGLAIDVPFESGQPELERLQYAKLGMTWEPPAGWPPESGQPQDGDDLNA